MLHLFDIIQKYANAQESLPIRNYCYSVTFATYYAASFEQQFEFSRTFICLVIVGPAALNDSWRSFFLFPWILQESTMVIILSAHKSNYIDDIST